MSKNQKRAYQLDENEEGLVFGDGDTHKRHPFPKGWMGRVVVRQSDVTQVGAGEYVEIPSSVKVMNYEVDTYDKLVRTGGFGELKILVLHDPR